MKAYSAAQIDFLETPTSVATRQDRPRFVLEIDHRRWMRFLIEEWLHPDETGVILLGLGCAVELELPSTATPVGIWIDQEKLPRVEVLAWRGGDWLPTPIDELGFSDTHVAWRGPLPLFSVHHFTFQSVDAKSHMMSMVRHFADIEVPVQPVLVETIEKFSVAALAAAPAEVILPPTNWDALRGAASMAMHAVPSIEPWLELLCDMLNHGRSPDSSAVVAAPWLSVALWDKTAGVDPSSPPLWRAITRCFSRPGLFKEWQPVRILQEVCADARALGYNDEELREASTMLLGDKGTIETLGLMDDLLALAFQLVLLRPAPGQFAQWKDDWPAVPPGAWWTGAILSGYLSGYRALPLPLRGSSEARQVLAVRTWALAGGEAAGGQWQQKLPGTVSWVAASETVIIATERSFLQELKFSNRGRWYQLNLLDDTDLAQAAQFAQKYCPHTVRPTIWMENASFHLNGTGSAAVNSSGDMLNVKGRIEIPVSAGISIVNRLDMEQFHYWLATASIDIKLPRPTGSVSTERAPARGQLPGNREAGHLVSRPALESGKGRAQAVSVEAPQGLDIIDDFITEEQEAALLTAIDAADWDSGMTRRVQHYGWRYDYKARKIDPSTFLGPLPEWAAALARALVESGRLAKFPDQVIVNEYLSNQSISRHIDCIPCFRGAIVTVSLNESWEMLFTRTLPGEFEHKYRVLLPRRSAAILDGPARYEWRHEIPKRMKDNGVPRGRRVSITFRKVAGAR